MNKVYVVGVGMTKFEKPEARQWRYFDMAREAGTSVSAARPKRVWNSASWPSRRA